VRRAGHETDRVGDQDQPGLVGALVGHDHRDRIALVDRGLAVVGVGEAEVELALAHQAHDVRVARPEEHAVVLHGAEARERRLGAELRDPHAGVRRGRAGERGGHRAAARVLRVEEVGRAVRPRRRVGPVLRVHDEHAAARGEAGPQVARDPCAARECRRPGGES
jgi:hypothetical protein